MKLAGLFSGGKDSMYAVWKASEEQEIAFLATIFSENPESYMFHTANIEMTSVQAEAIGINLVINKSAGTKEGELLDLKTLLDGADIEGVVCGAIASKYQRDRIEKICKDLGLKLICPLWGVDAKEYMKEIAENWKVIITSVSADGFDESWLGRKIDENCLKDLLEMRKKFGTNLAGEGGEYETFVLDGPIFKKKIKIIRAEKMWNGDSGIYLIKDVKLVKK